MVRPSALIGRARSAVQDPQGRIRVVIAVVFLAIAAAALLTGGLT
ncbi:hypothetical protein [Spirillospora sp. CA-128828]